MRKIPFFSDKFPEYTDNIELKNIQKEHPLLDEAYIAGAMIPIYRKKYEELWELFVPFIDSHFLGQYKLKNNFLDRVWELYIGAYLVTHSIEFHTNDIGPDFEITKEKAPVAYIEAISIDHGIGPDAVPEYAPSSIDKIIIREVPEEKMLLRMSSGLYEKYKELRKALDNKIITKNVPIVIALNSGKFTHPQNPGIPLIAKALFEIGFMALSMPKSLITNKREVIGRFWSNRSEVSRTEKDPIPMSFFLHENHRIISAVFWTDKTLLNHPEVLGSDIYVIHNPFALNPLDENLFSSMKHVHLKDSKLEYHDL